MLILNFDRVQSSPKYNNYLIYEFRLDLAKTLFYVLVRAVSLIRRLFCQRKKIQVSDHDHSVVC